MKLSFKNDNEIKTFSGKWKEFTTENSALKDILKDIFQKGSDSKKKGKI